MDQQWATVPARVNSESAAHLLRTSISHSSFAAVVHGLASSKRVRYGVETEWRLAAEAGSRVIAKVVEFSDFVQEGSSDDEERGGLYSASQVSEQTCTTENQLAAAILKRAGGKYWVNICPPDPASGTSHRMYPALTLEAAMRLLQRHCGLQSYSVLDTMASTHRMKLDSDADSLYCSLVAFSQQYSTASLPSSEHAEALGASERPTGRWRLRGFHGRRWKASQQPLLPTHSQGPRGSIPPGKTSSQGYYSCSSGTLQDLVHLGIPPGTLAHWKQPLTGGGGVHWQRACFFLTHSAIITVFREPLGAAEVTDEVQRYFATPEAHLMELSKGPSYLFYKLVEAVVQQLEGVLLGYRKALLACEEHTFKGQQLLSQDLQQQRQLHLMQQELRVIRQQLQPADSLLSAMLELTTTTEPKGMPLPAASDSPGPAPLQARGRSYSSRRDRALVDSETPPADSEAGSLQSDYPKREFLPLQLPGMVTSRRLLNEETLDFLQEVQDDITARLMETDELIGACKELELLMNATTAYRTSVSMRLLAAVAAICLPLLCLTSIYGTNFAILPELTWGVTSSDPVQPSGYPLGYVWMLMLMALFALCSVRMLKQQQILQPR